MPRHALFAEDAAGGLGTRLSTVKASRASVDQRRGRAGRLSPGVCYRLWDEAATRGLMPAPVPEILKSDLSKCRFDPDFDASATGGYRDLQLSVKLRCKEAVERGVDNHVCELQLQLEDFRALKSEQGHAGYVIRRNLLAQ